MNGRGHDCDILALNARISIYYSCYLYSSHDNIKLNWNLNTFFRLIHVYNIIIIKKIIKKKGREKKEKKKIKRKFTYKMKIWVLSKIVYRCILKKRGEVAHVCIKLILFYISTPNFLLFIYYISAGFYLIKYWLIKIVWNAKIKMMI
jgi:hypothetical protein